MAGPYEYGNTAKSPLHARQRHAKSLFLWASGFGIGALIVLFGFLFLVGIGDLRS